MSLPILMAIVAVGITLTVAAVHLTGGSREALVADAEAARRIFAADFPDEAPAAVVVTADRRSAFLELPGGRTGIVQSFGDGHFTRIVRPRDVAGLELPAPTTLAIRFRDFTWTGGRFVFDSAAEAAQIAAAVDPAPRSARVEAMQ